MINVTKTFLPPIREYELLLQKLWDSNQLTNRGQLVSKLEKEIQEFLDLESTPLAVCNGTIALQIAIKAMELRGEIITTPFSYVATTSCIVWEGCTPVFVDIHPEYLTIDETKIESAITKNTSAILATHVYGNPCNVDIIEKIAKKHNLKVIYDAAHCFGVKYKGKSIFDYGDVSTCSFHATKVFHTGEGGAIFCNDSLLMKKITSFHRLGHKGQLDYDGLGINAKMSEINAAMGLSVLKYFQSIKDSRSRVVEYYDSNITKSSLRKMKIREGTNWNYSYYPIIFCSEKELLKAEKSLNEKNIYPRRYFFPSLNKLPYVDSEKMENSEKISSCILCLPLSHDISNENLDQIIGYL